MSDKAFLMDGPAGGTLLEDGAGDPTVTVRFAIKGRVHQATYTLVGPGLPGEVNYTCTMVIENVDTDNPTEVPVNSPVLEEARLATASASKTKKSTAAPKKTTTATKKTTASRKKKT